MVTNLFSLPDWLIETAKKHFDGRIETTYALGAKSKLNGSQEGYHEQFKKNLRKGISRGLTIPVNIEMNKETISRGPREILDLAIETGATKWEFDISVDFEAFLKNQEFSHLGYPILKSTATYKDLEEYCLTLASLHENEIAEIGFENTLLDHAKHKMQSLSFNVCQELNFVTVNPDGSVTTNPLFSDIKETYLGNIKKLPLDIILSSPKRYRRSLQEKNRKSPCLTCRHYDLCGGGPSHVSVRDGSGTCSGVYALWTYYNLEA